MGRVKDELWSGEDLGIDSYDFADFSESETRELEQWLDFLDAKIGDQYGGAYPPGNPLYREPK